MYIQKDSLALENIEHNVRDDYGFSDDRYRCKLGVPA